MGEFSLKNWKVEGGVMLAGLAAGLLIALPSVFSYLLRIGFAGTLTTHDVRALSTFILYAMILGAAVASTMFIYGCYRKGTRPRLLFGIISGALIIIYSFVVLVASGLTSVLSDIGLQLDTIFAALMVSYASVVLMFHVGGEFIASRRKLQEPVKSDQAGLGGAP